MTVTCFGTSAIVVGPGCGAGGQRGCRGDRPGHTHRGCLLRSRDGRATGRRGTDRGPLDRQQRPGPRPRSQRLRGRNEDAAVSRTARSRWSSRTCCSSSREPVRHHLSRALLLLLASSPPSASSSAHGLTIFDVEELATHGGSLRIYAGHMEPDPDRSADRVRAASQSGRSRRFTTMDYYGTRSANR